jgi:putative membrane protein
MGDNQINSNTNEHLANERTFLAWVRTSIGIMAFGFVVVKFSLFVKQIGIVLGKQIILQQHGFSNIIGIVLVAAGSSSLILSFIQYKRTEKQINNGNYISSSWLTGALAIFIFLVSIFLIIYLINSI